MFKYKLFPNLFVHSVGGKKVAVFHPFSFNLVYLSDRDYYLLKNNLFSNVDKSLLDKLDSFDILVKRNFDYSEYISNKKIEHQEKQGGSLGVFYFILSEKCNISCAYCFLKTERSHSPKIMSSKDGIEAALFLAKCISAKNSLRPVRVIFYGGEPLLNFATMRIIVMLLRGLEAKGKFGRRNIDFLLLTNGTLMTRQMASFLVRHKINTVFSIDGPFYLHDGARLSRKGNGTFLRAMKGYRLVKEAGGIPSIALTIGSHNVNHLSRIAEYFVNKLQPQGIGFNIMKDSYFIKNPYQAPMQESCSAILRSYEILRSYGIYEERVGRYVRAIENKQPSYFCGAYGRQVVFLPNGDLLPCHAFFPTEKNRVGNIYRDNAISLFNNSIFKMWASRTSLAIAQCKHCPAIMLCDGGCAHEAEASGGAFWNIDEKTCVFFKEFLRWYVEDKFKQKEE